MSSRLRFVENNRLRSRLWRLTSAGPGRTATRSGGRYIYWSVVGRSNPCIKSATA